MKKARVNFLMPIQLHEFVKEEAAKLGIPASTMYIMIVNLYKDNNTAMQALRTIQEAQKEVKINEDTP